MSPELTAKVRLVRCPKCRQLLAELPDIPVYKCGGCGITLQAKARVNGLRSKSASLNDTEAAQRIHLDHASEDKKSRSSARNATLSESGECSSDQENERDQKESSEGNESSTSSTPKATYPESGNCFSNQNNEKDEDKPSEEEKSSSSSHNAAPLDQENERDQKKSSEGNESSTSSTPKATYPESGNCFSKQNNEKDEDKPSEEEKSSSLSHNAAALDQENERDQMKSSEGNESSTSSTPKATYPESGNCFSNQNNEKDEDQPSEEEKSSSSSHNAAPLDQGNERDQKKSSEGNESSTSSTPKATYPESGNCFSNQNNEKDEDKPSEEEKSSSSSHNAAPLDQENERDQMRSSEGNESSTSSTPKATYPESGNCFSNQNNEKDEDQPSEEEKSSSSSHNAAALDQENERDQMKSSEGNESSTSSTPKATYPESGNCFSNQNNEKDEDQPSEEEKSSSSSHNAAPLDQENERDQKKSSEGNESSTSSTPKATYPESGNCFSNQNNEKDEDKPSEEEKSSSSSHNAAPLDQGNERDQKKSSEGNESSTSSTPKATYPESGNFFSNQNNEKNEDKPSEEKKSSSSSHNGALPEQNDEGDWSKSSEDNESSSPSTRKPTFLESGKYSLDQNNEKSEDKSSEVKESSISTQNASLSNPGEYFSDQNKEKSEDKSSEDEGSSTSGHNASLSKSGECTSDQHETDNPVISKSSEGNESSSLSPKATVRGECFSDLNNEKEQIKSSEGNKFSSSSPKSTFPDSGECLLDQNNERDLSEPSEGNKLSSSSPEATFPDSGKCFSEQDNKKSEIKSSDDEEFGSANHGATLPDSGECTSDQTSMKGPDESSEDCDHEQVGDINLPNEDQNNQRDQNDSHDFDSEKLEVSNEFCSSTEFAHDEVKETLPKTQKGAEVSTNDESSPSGETNVDVGINKEIDSDFQSSNTVNKGDVRGSSSIVAAHTAAREIISSYSFESSRNEQVEPRNSVPNGFDHVRSPVAFESIVTAHMAVRESVAADSLTSSPNGQLEEPQNSAFSIGFDHVGSPDAFGNMEFFPSLELRGAPRNLSRSPANRSHHAYDASVSSYDGMDDQFFNRNTRSNIVHSEERIRRDKFTANSMMTRDSGLQRQARDPWSNLPVKNDHAMKYRKWDQDALLPPRRQGHPSRDWNRLQSDEYMSRMAFRRRVSQGGYKNRGLTNQLHNEYQHNSGYQSSEISVEAEQDKRTLLRMVFELQDQVNNLNGKASGRVARGATWKEKSMAQHGDYEASEEELYHDPIYQRYLRRHRAGSHYPPEHHRKNMRIPFSSEATTSRHQADSSYLHYEPQDWQCSAPLPQPVRCSNNGLCRVPVRCSNNGLCRVHPGHSCWTSYDKSRPLTPERYVESDFPLWGRETMSDDLRHQRHDVKKLYREKQHLAKRHFRPIAGGAPIITCYNCSKLLQIPADFLLFKRRYHRLRCGACLEVLRYSLRKRSHIVPYEQNAIAPPPSEVGDYNAAANGGNLAQHADTVSCSDDYGYGPSYYNGYSTDGDPGALAPSNSPRGDSEDRNMSYSSLDQMRERKELVLRESQNKDKNPIETFVSTRPSLSSEIKELPAKSSSPLHRLMGYASPSQVIRGSGSSQTGRSSYPLQR